MDEGRNGGLIAWMIDAAAAVALASAAGMSGLLLANVEVGMMCAAIVLVVGLWSLRQVPAEAIMFKLPALVPVGWDCVFSEPADDGDCLELTTLADAASADSLSNVACLNLALPTPGEMQRRIERHLVNLFPASASTTAPSAEVVPIGADASAALRMALGNLRRSVG